MMYGTIRIESSNSLKTIRLDDVKPLSPEDERAVIAYLQGIKSEELYVRFVNLHNYLKSHKSRLVCMICNKTGVFSTDYTISPISRNSADKVNLHLRVLSPCVHSQCHIIEHVNLEKSRKPSTHTDSNGSLTKNPPVSFNQQSYFTGLPFSPKLTKSTDHAPSAKDEISSTKVESDSLCKLLTTGFTSSGLQNVDFDFINKQSKSTANLNSTIDALRNAYSQFKHKKDTTFSLESMIAIFPKYKEEVFQLAMDRVELAWATRWGKVAAPFAYIIFPIDTISKSEGDKSTTITANDITFTLPFRLRVPIANSIEKSGPFIIIAKCMRKADGLVEICDAYSHPIIGSNFWMLIDSYLEREAANSLFDLVIQYHSRGDQISIEHPLQNMEIGDESYGRPDFIVRANGSDFVSYIETNGKANKDYWDQKFPLHSHLGEKLIIDDRSAGDVLAANSALTKNLLIKISSHFDNSKLAIFIRRCFMKISPSTRKSINPSQLILTFQYASKFLNSKFKKENS